VRYKDGRLRGIRVDAVSRRVLEAYDQLGRDTLELSALARFVPVPDPHAVGAVVAQLIARGCLRPAGAPEAFARTEDGRIAIAGRRKVTIYTRPGCHLCEEAKTQIAPLLGEFGARLREVNIDADPVLRERYTNDVPVIFLGPRKVAKHRLDLAQFRRQLASAAADSA
jgi:glutaredoxin